MRIKILPVVAFMLLFMALATPAPATEQFAAKTGLPCAFCHKNPAGGGTLTDAGHRYETLLSNQAAPSPAIDTLRFVIGYLHILAGIIWFGAIFYVHIILKPAYAAKGLPKGELILGWAGIIVVGLTGIFLTISVMPSFGALFHSRFGILLSIKIFLYMIMTASAAVVTFVIGPRLRKRIAARSTAAAGGEDGESFTPDTLSNFDGMDGRRAYAAVAGNVYDLTQSPLWKNGKHARHLAGMDLSAAIKQAPHGPEKLDAFPKAGTLLPSPPVGEGGAKRRERTEAGTTVNKPKAAFYFLAYMNLTAIFLVIAIIALWRWWP